MPATLSQEVQPQFSTLLFPLLVNCVGSGPSIPSVYSLPLEFLVSKATAPHPHEPACKPRSLLSLRTCLSYPLKRVSIWLPCCSAFSHSPSCSRVLSQSIAGHSVQPAVLGLAAMMVCLESPGHQPPWAPWFLRTPVHCPPFSSSYMFTHRYFHKLSALCSDFKSGLCL